MKRAIMLMLLVNSVAAVAAQDCKPLSEAPAILSMSVKDGKNQLVSSKILGKGKTFAKAKWSQETRFSDGSFDVSITPVSSCASGLKIRVDDSGAIYERVVAWDTKVIVSGDDSSSHYVKVTASRIKP